MLMIIIIIKEVIINKEGKRGINFFYYTIFVYNSRSLQKLFNYDINKTTMA